MIQVITFGCRLNTFDSIEIENSVKGMVTSEDIYIINSCCVTDKAERTGLKKVREILKKNPNAKIIMSGCGTRARKSLSLDSKAEYGYDIAKDKEEVVSLLQSKYLEETCHPELTVGDVMPIRSRTNERTRVLIPIQHGCDTWCSYCIIPQTRGKHRDVPIKDVIEEIKNAESDGAMEVVFTGVNIAAWGCSNTRKTNESKFAYFLEEILKNTTIPRIRLSSVGPEFITDEVIEVLKNPRIADQLHLSIQSGSSRTLKRMNRLYSREDLDVLIPKLYKAIPNLGITTDLIVGFPGETEGEFEESMDLIQKYELSKCHVFPYSRRSNTPADLRFREEELPEHKVLDRAKKMRELANDYREKFKLKQVGTTQEILWESEKNGKIEGWTSNYVKVHISKESNKINKFTSLEITPDVFV